VRDEDVPASAARLAPAIAKLAGRVKHMRMVTADCTAVSA
jgi:hypothetical protein